VPSSAVPGRVRKVSLTAGRPIHGAVGIGTGARGDELGQTSVKGLGAGLSGDKNAGGFDVTVDDAFGVGGIEGVGDCDGELQPEIGLRGSPAMRCFGVHPGIPSR